MDQRKDGLYKGSMCAFFLQYTYIQTHVCVCVYGCSYIKTAMGNNKDMEVRGNICTYR